MQIYLASFLQPENFGSGRLISITNSEKPKNIIVKSIFEQFIPSDEIINKYKKDKLKDLLSAGNNFSIAYKKQLSEFISFIENKAQENNVKLQDILDLQDQDTLLSWERSYRNNYRSTLAEVLSPFYTIILN